jgi:egghead protein (zeste-white 4 protein)
VRLPGLDVALPAGARATASGAGYQLRDALLLFVISLVVAGGAIWIGERVRRRLAAAGRAAAPRAAVWRAVGFATAIVMVLTYLLAVVSTLAAVPAVLGLDSSVALVPGGRLYTYSAVLLSVALTAIALRYIYYYYCWARSRRYFRKPSPINIAALSQRELPRIKVQITTKGGALPVVQRGLRELEQSLERHPWLAARLTAEVVTEEALEVAEIRREFRRSVLRVDAILLPADYETPRGTKLKARAMHYLVERRIAGPPVARGECYVVHFDEETIVTDAHLLVLVDYLSGDPKPVSQGPILYPLEWEQTPWICKALESMRPFGCSECARVMEHPPPPHLHGSNLVVDEAAENEIGWDFGTLEGQPYIAEDLLFGLRAYAVLGDEGFGWHGATMLEQPPFSLHWAVQQRMRWVLGALQGLTAMRTQAEYDGISSSHQRRLQIAITFRIATYALGFPLGFAGVYFFLRPVNDPVAFASPLGVWRLLIIVSGVMWLASYQIGLARNLRYRSMGWRDRVKHHVLILVLTPVTGLCETAGPYVAVLRWLVGARSASWTPTPKLSDRTEPDDDSVTQAESAVQPADEPALVR